MLTHIKTITRVSLCLLALTAASCADVDTPAPPAPAASTEAPPTAHPCADTEADIADGYCQVGDQWYVVTDGQWTETDQGPTPPEDTADAATTSTVAEDTGEAPAEAPVEVVSIAGVETIVDEALIPEPEILEEVFEAVIEAVPDSEVTLQDCTDWANAGFGDALDEDQKAQCIAKIAAAVETCAELECFPTTTEAPTTTQPPTTTEPPTTTQPPTTTEPPTTTQPPTTTEAPTTTQPPTTTEPPTTTQPPTTTEAPTTTQPPTTTEAPTTTQPPTTTEAPTTTQPPTTTEAPPVVEAPYSVGRPVGTALEGGHPPAPTIGMIPRELPYWDHPNCAPAPPWDSGCYPPSEWELPPDLEGCLPSPDGRVCANDRPDEVPRLTVEAVRWISWCGNQPRSPCQWLVRETKWALDFLGAHPWCVFNEYEDRVNVYAAGGQGPRNIRDLHGWHNCATVIDPIVGTPDAGRSNDAGLLLSHTGISLAEQCRRVLPTDIQLEDSPRRITLEVQRFGSNCDAWAAWVENRVGASDYRVCDRSARLAEEWMEHHYGVSEYYHSVTC